MCVKVLLNDEQQPIGQVILHNAESRTKIDGKLELVEVFKKEEDRVAGLQKWFGIRISEQDKKEIVDLPTELRGWNV